MSSSSVYKNSSRKEYKLTTAQRDTYRRISHESRQAKLAAEQGLFEPVHAIPTPRFNPELLMPILELNYLTCLSLFSGGGGMDLGFDRAGFSHTASYELIPICGETYLTNRPNWNIYTDTERGDVTKVDWVQYQNKIDIVHGGPPCQPFSIAGEQQGELDERNMWGEFSRAINTIKPQAFVAENVLGLLNPKFEDFIKKFILEPLADYSIIKFEMNAADFGVPQIRRRVFFVGFRSLKAFKAFKIPEATHTWEHLGKIDQIVQTSLSFEVPKPKTMGVREALGLVSTGFDNLAPTIRSGFTGKRNTTSILNSAAGQKSWADLLIWPNGIQASREKAVQFPAKSDHFRLSVQDVGLLQGFPESWKFAGAVYQVLGQIGNSVAPPVAYQVAKNVALALKQGI